MPIVQPQSLFEFGEAIFQAAGLPDSQARIAIDHLVESNLMGHDSHGVMHVPRYTRQLLNKEFLPVGGQRIVRETPVERAQTHTLAAIAVHHTGHIGRLGAFPPLAAQKDCIGLIMLNGGAQFVAPFGGVDRRLPPNPIAMSVPTPDGPPLTLDITTSMVAGGKVSVQQARNEPVPAGWLIDENGNAVTDPALFREGMAAMLPMGGPIGHKGYGLAMMVEAMAGALSWAGCSADPPTRGGSGYLAMAIKIESFIDVDEYKEEIRRLSEWVKSSRTMPDVDRIYLPGEKEEETRGQRERDGIPIPESVWTQLLESADWVGVTPIEVGE
jgi:uncharacterized oxidoreductase